MKQCIIIIVLMTLLSSNILTEDMYNAIEIKTIPFGKADGQLGYNNVDFIPGAGYPQPLFFTITEKDKLFVYDWANNRICIFGQELNFLEKKEFKNYIGYIYSMKIDEDENIYLEQGSRLLRITKDGIIAASIKSSLLPSKVGSEQGYYPKKGHIFFYNDRYELGYFDPAGKKIEGKDFASILNEINTPQRNSSDPDLKQVIDKYNQKKRMLFFDDNLVVNNSEEYINYFIFTRNNITKRSYKEKKLDKTELFRSMRNLLGFDIDGNIYWQNGVKIIVFSKFGDIIVQFQFEGNIYRNPAVKMNGDIYLWTFKPEGVVFAKIPRFW